MSVKPGAANLPDNQSLERLFARLRSGALRSIIFDLDGVLIDSSAGIIDTTNYVLRNLGRPEREPAEIKRFIGSPLPAMFAAFAPDEAYDSIRPLFRKRAREVIVQSSELLPFACETLQRLRSCGFELAIGSTKIREHIVGVVEKFALGAFVDVIVGGDEARPKPAPDIFLLALERLGAKKESTVVIGDTINDALAAEAAGIPVITVASEFGSPGELDSHPALAHMDNLREFTELLCPIKADESVL